MAIVELEFDTICLCREEYDRCIADGKILSSTAILNRRWEDYSAAKIAIDFGLKNVHWDIVGDDTPGTLLLAVNYFDLAPADLAWKFRNMDSLCNYTVCNPLHLQNFR